MTITPENYFVSISALHCIKSCRYRQTPWGHVHINHENGDKNVISVIDCVLIVGNQMVISLDYPQ